MRAVLWCSLVCAALLVIGHVWGAEMERRFLVLRALADGPRSGRHIRAATGTSLLVHGTLRAMERRGLVYSVPSRGGVVYHLSADGRAFLSVFRDRRKP